MKKAKEIKERLKGYYIDKYTFEGTFEQILKTLSELKKTIEDGNIYRNLYIEWEYGYDEYTEPVMYGIRDETKQEIDKRVEKEKREKISKEMAQKTLEKVEYEKYLKLKEKYEK